MLKCLPYINNIFAVSYIYLLCMIFIEHNVSAKLSLELV